MTAFSDRLVIVRGAGDLATGTIHDVMLIRNEKELKEFMEMYGLETVPETEY